MSTQSTLKRFEVPARRGWHPQMLLHEGERLCDRCGGCGGFVIRVENGLPVTRGPCFRCAGKGYQTDEDRRRNWGYDQNRPARIG